MSAIRLVEERTWLPSRISFQRNFGALRSCVQRFALAQKLDIHQGCVNTIRWNTSGTLLASSGDDVNAVGYDWQKQQVVFHIPTGHRGNVFSVQFMPERDDEYILTAAADGETRLHVVGHGPLHTYPCHRASVHRICVIPGNPHWWMTAGSRGTIRAFDMREPHHCAAQGTRKCSNVLVHWDDVCLYGLDISPRNPALFVACGHSHQARLYDQRFLQPLSFDTACIKPVQVFEPENDVMEGDHATSCVFSPDGQEILVSYSDHPIYRFQVDGKEEETVYDGHLNSMTIKECNFFGSKGEYVMSGSDNGYVFVWEKESGNIVNLFKADGDVVNSVQPCPNGSPLLATSGIEANVKLWMPLEPNGKACKERLGVFHSNERDTLFEGQGSEFTQSAALLQLLHHALEGHQGENVECQTQ